MPIVGEWLRWTYIHNDGAAFGLFRGSRWIFVAVSVVSITVLYWLRGKSRFRGLSAATALGLTFGGAIGNLVDRLWLGRVIDFIDLGSGPSRLPIFNVADAAITVGTCLLAVHLSRRPAHSETSS